VLSFFPVVPFEPFSQTPGLNADDRIGSPLPVYRDLVHLEATIDVGNRRGKPHLAQEGM